MNLNNDSFYVETAKDGKKVVQFTASWCGPCRFLSPRLDRLSQEHGFDYFKVDVDENTELARDFQIMSIPTVQVYENGRVQNTFVGVKSDKELVDELGLTD